MRVEFRKGFIRRRTGEKIACVWARTPNGSFSLANGAGEELQPLDQADIIDECPITSLDLPGLGRDLVETIVLHLIRGGYLERPGVQGKGDAALFILVNEAIQQLRSVADQELEDEH